jgi:hypothetical protein
MEYDVFISHASEDKSEVALPLARYLESLGLKVWLDEFELTIGDSLRRMIDHGLATSRFGIVVLSPSFFRKGWTNRELDGLVAREDTEKFILPIWHNVTREDVTKFSPTLAGKLAVSTNQGIEHVARQVMRAIQRDAPLPAATQLNSLSAGDERTRELSELRRNMLEAHSSWELRELLFSADEFLSRYPNYPEARLLRERILRAIEHEEGPMDSAPPMGALPRRSILSYILLLGLLIGGILVLIRLLLWLLGR